MHSVGWLSHHGCSTPNVYHIVGYVKTFTDISQDGEDKGSTFTFAEISISFGNYRVFQKKVPTLFFGIFQLQRHL